MYQVTKLYGMDTSTLLRHILELRLYFFREHAGP